MAVQYFYPNDDYYFYGSGRFPNLTSGPYIRDQGASYLYSTAGGPPPTYIYFEPNIGWENIDEGFPSNDSDYLLFNQTVMSGNTVFNLVSYYNLYWQDTYSINNLQKITINLRYKTDPPGGSALDNINLRLSLNSELYNFTIPADTSNTWSTVQKTFNVDYKISGALLDSYLYIYSYPNGTSDPFPDFYLSSLELQLSGDYYYTTGPNLYISGPLSSNSGINLYTKGHISSSGITNLNIHGKSSYNDDLYLSEYGHKEVNNITSNPNSLDGWTGYFALTSKHNSIKDYIGQTYIDLSLINSSTWWNNVKTDGSDIRITDTSNNELNFRLQLFDKINHSGWVQFSSSGWLSTSTDKEIRIWCGNNSATMPNYNVFDSSVAAFYDFAQNPASSNLIDQTSNGKNGVPGGSPSLQSGPLGKSWRFSGGNYAQLSGALNGRNTFTLAAWVKVNGGTGYRTIFADDATESTSAGPNRYLGINTGGYPYAQLIYANLSSYQTGSNPGSILTDWQLLFFVVRPDNTIKLYQNGSEIASVYAGADALTPPTPIERIGCDVEGSYPFTGDIGYFAIYDRILTPEEIETHYNNQSYSSGIWSPSGFISTESMFSLYISGKYPNINNNTNLYEQGHLFYSNITNNTYYKLTSKSSQIYDIIKTAYIDLSLINSSEWWALTYIDGSNISLTDDNNDELDFTLLSFNKSNHTGWIQFNSSSWISVSVDKEIRIHVSNTSIENNYNIFDNSVIVAYNFEQDPSSSNLLDMTNNHYDGTVYGSMTSGQLIDGKIGKAWNFDGSNDYINTNTVLFNTDKLTIATWVKFNDLKEQVIVESSTNMNSNSNTFYLGMDPDYSLEFTIHGTSSYNLIGTSILSSGTWYYLVATLDKSLSSDEAKGFISGIADWTRPGYYGYYNNDTTGNFANFPIYIASRNGTSFANIAISEFIIYSGILSDNQIYTHFINQNTAGGIWNTGEFIEESSNNSIFPLYIYGSYPKSTNSQNLSLTGHKYINNIGIQEGNYFELDLIRSGIVGGQSGNIVIYDSFDGTDTDDVNGRSLDIGGTWSQGLTQGGNSLEISGNMLYKPTWPEGNSTIMTDSSISNCIISCDMICPILPISGNSQGFRIFFRSDSTNSPFNGFSGFAHFVGFFYVPSTQRMLIQAGKITNGSASYPYSDVDAGPYNSGLYTIKTIVYGSGLTAQLLFDNNIVGSFNWYDNSYNSNTKVGLSATHYHITSPADTPMYANNFQVNSITDPVNKKYNLHINIDSNTYRIITDFNNNFIITDPIDWNADQSTIQTKLGSNFYVSGSYPDFEIELIQDYAANNSPLLYISEDISSVLCDLYISGELIETTNNINNNLDLFVNNIDLNNNNLPLYISGNTISSISDDTDLSIYGKSNNSGIIPLYINGADFSNNNLSLYIIGNSNYNSGIDLYINGKSFSSDNTNLFINAYDLNNEDVPLYVCSIGNNSGNFDLFINGHIPENNNIDLYVLSKGTIYNSGTNLYISGWYHNKNDNIDLYMIGSLIDSGNTTLYTKGGNSYGMNLFLMGQIGVKEFNATDLSIKGGQGLLETIDLSISGNRDQNSYLNLFIPGISDFPEETSYLNIFVKNHNINGSISNSSNIDLFINNEYKLIGSGINLFMQTQSGNIGSIPYNSNINLYIGRNSEGISDITPIYLAGPSGLFSSTQLFIQGQPNDRNSTNLYISGKEIINNIVRLYINGY